MSPSARHENTGMHARKDEDFAVLKRRANIPAGKGVALMVFAVLAQTHIMSL